MTWAKLIENPESGIVYLWDLAPEPCGCPGARLAQRNENMRIRKSQEDMYRTQEEAAFAMRMMGITGSHGDLPRKFTRCRFDTYEPSSRSQKAAKRVVQSYVRKIETGTCDPGRNWMFIYGPPGSGKTHLAASMVNALHAKQISGVVFQESDALFADIRSAMTDRGRSEAKALDFYSDAPLLVIDDIGKESNSAWVCATMFSLLNSRYANELPTVLTSNFDFREFIARIAAGSDRAKAAAIESRMRGCCSFVPVEGDDYRSRMVPEEE